MLQELLDAEWIDPANPNVARKLPGWTLPGQSPTVSFIVPTLNEAKNLPHVLPFIPAWAYEVILVDGRSSDDTIAVARELLPDIRVVLEPRKGKGIALRSGFQAAKGDIIVMIDADGSTDPRESIAFIGALLSGADFAKGSRFMQGGGTDDMEPFRYFGNWSLTKLVCTLFRNRYTDLCYGYNAFWRRELPRLDLQAHGFEIETQMNIRALRAGLNVVEVPSFEEPRIYGTSNLNAIRDGFRVLSVIAEEFIAEVKLRGSLLPKIPRRAESRRPRVVRGIRTEA